LLQLVYLPQSRFPGCLPFAYLASTPLFTFCIPTIIGGCLLGNIPLCKKITGRSGFINSNKPFRMTDRQILTIKISWSYVVRDSGEAALLFYDKLFALNPALKVLFRNDMELQARKLISMLTMIVSRLQMIGEVADEISALGRRHVGYGVKPGDYTTVGQALIWMLEQRLEEHWTQETREAWELMYQQLSNRMIQVAKTINSTSL
jgi:hemoglobin-like flavoprotein